MGIFENGKLLHSWRLHSNPELSLDEYLVLVQGMLFASRFKPDSIQSAVLSSVVPKLSRVFSGLVEQLIGVRPIVVSHELELGIRVNTDNPESVGHDRLVNAVAAYHTHRVALVIIDFGTATTLDVVSSSGVFQGGIICPGLSISAEALFSRAAQLYQVEIEEPRRLIGKNTIEAVKSGLFYGYSGMIESLIRRLERELKAQGEQHVVAVATGGLAVKLESSLPGVLREDDLTLQGLYLIHSMNLERS
jgi:type III pantothenate kinase